MLWRTIWRLSLIHICCVPDNTPFRPKAGVAMIAQLARAPVLPACIYCDGEPRPFRRVSVRLGPVISEDTFESEEKKRDILKRCV